MLLALAGRYAFESDSPQLAERFSRAAYTYYADRAETHTLSTYAECYLATALSQLGKDAEAEKQAASCMSSSQQLGDSHLLMVANAAAAFVYSSAHDPGKATESIRYLLAHEPNAPFLYEELARACAQLEKHDSTTGQPRKGVGAVSKKAIGPVRSRGSYQDRTGTRDPLPREVQGCRNSLSECGIHLCYDHDPSGRTRALLVLAKYFSAQRPAQKS